MSAPDIVKGAYVDILVGDGATPEVFTPICGITTRNFTKQVNTNDVFVPDCDDPEALPHRRANPTGVQWDLAGEGLLNLKNWQAVDADAGVTKNYRFAISRPTGTAGTGYYEGPAMITNMQIGAVVGDGTFASLSLTIVSDGVWEITDLTTP